jgi:hypothetical protein
MTENGNSAGNPIVTNLVNAVVHPASVGVQTTRIPNDGQPGEHNESGLATHAAT